VSRLKAADANLEAARYSFQNARDLVVLAVASTYLQVIAAQARVSAAQAEVKTAESLFEKASDMHKAGVVPSIDALRAQVELKTRQQQLLAAKNGLETAKLTLDRAIGLPMDQSISLTTETPFSALPPLTFEEALKTALSHRADYQSALALNRQAEEARIMATWASLLESRMERSRWRAT
jgi:outer membrane protein TolC